MNEIIIEGGHELSGSVKIGGDKNSIVALIPAAILSNETVVIENVPDISDIESLREILDLLNVPTTFENGVITINPSDCKNTVIDKEHSRKLRASYYFMGALLSKYKTVSLGIPGGCSIGERPINLHLKGFKALGATVVENDGDFVISAEKLIGNDIYLDIASVGATINIMLAAVYAEGVTTIENAAKEPQIVNLAMFLNNMGAKITGAGTSEIKITGVESLKGCTHEVIPDRIEAGTYMVIASLLGKNMKIENIIPEHVEALTSKLTEIGVDITTGHNYFIINRKDNYKSIDIQTQTYPGFPTDLQQVITPLLTQIDGISKIDEKMFENRFMNIQYLNLMGANIKIEDSKAYIYGKTPLYGQNVVATDLRAGACMIVAGLIASGTTTITNINHILRGYEKIIEKLTNVGAKITLN